MKIVLLLFSLLSVSTFIKNQPNKADVILGKWETVRNNLIVEVYKDNNNYKAKVLWFKDTDDKTRPMNVRTDYRNPDPALRNRKVLGMDVLNNLIYNPKDNRWEKGEIYDCSSGRTWSSSVWLTDEGLLKVRGFWHFEFIGQTLVFKRV